MSVLLTSRPVRDPEERYMLGPFSRYRRFKITRNRISSANFIHQYNCFRYFNCGCESIPAQDRVDVTRRFKTYVNESGETKLSDIFNEIERNNPIKEMRKMRIPLQFKNLALSVSQELRKRWVLSKSPQIITTRYSGNCRNFFRNLPRIYFFSTATYFTESHLTSLYRS